MRSRSHGSTPRSSGYSPAFASNCVFPYGTVLYWRWPNPGTRGDVLALYVIHGNVGVLLLSAHASESSLPWDMSDATAPLLAAVLKRLRFAAVAFCAFTGRALVASSRKE